MSNRVLQKICLVKLAKLGLYSQIYVNTYRSPYSALGFKLS